jgi:hypothetical protein
MADARGLVRYCVNRTLRFIQMDVLETESGGH